MKRVATCAVAMIVLPLELGAANAPDRPFSVTMTGLEVLAVPADSPGAERLVKPNERILNAQVGIEHGALLGEGRSLTVSGLDFSLPRNTALLATRTATGGELGRGTTAGVFCDKAEDGLAYRTKHGTYENGHQRYRNTTRLCLVDTDNDHRFDKAFVVGALLPRDWRLTDIDPVRYTVSRHLGLGKGWSMNVYYNPVSAAKGAFGVTLNLHSRRVDLDTVKLRGKKMQATRARTKFDATKLPFRYKIGSAVFAVTAVGKDGATLRQESGLENAPLTFSVINRTKVIIIYY